VFSDSCLSVSESSVSSMVTLFAFYIVGLLGIGL
jgi:hypothetical protein